MAALGQTNSQLSFDLTLNPQPSLSPIDSSQSGTLRVSGLGTTTNVAGSIKFITHIPGSLGDYIVLAPPGYSGHRGPLQLFLFTPTTQSPDDHKMTPSEPGGYSGRIELAQPLFPTPVRQSSPVGGGRRHKVRKAGTPKIADDPSAIAAAEQIARVNTKWNQTMSKFMKK